MRTNGCTGPVTRRAFLQAGCLGIANLGLGDLLRARASDSRQRPKSCILVWLVGGQSQLETYDLKPEAPAEYRGLFKPIRTRVPGLEIGELLPRQAGIADKFSLIRSISHKFPGHVDGAQMFLTGYDPKVVNPLTIDNDYPDIACVYKAVTPARQDGLPTSAAVRHELYYTGPAYLGVKNRQFVVPSLRGDRPEFQVPNLAVTREAMPRFGDRLTLKRSFDSLRRDLDSKGVVDAMDTFDQEAVRMITGAEARRAFDVNLEEPKTRDRYGRSMFGQGLLLARRLVEAGVGFVSVDGGWFADVDPILQDNWDDHETNRNIFEAAKKRLPPYDQGLTALIEDVHARGLDRDVLVVVTGEFGRTPLIYHHNGTPGRGHHPGAMTVLISGGGMRMGQVIGATDNRAAAPSQRLLHPGDLLATIYRFLGVDPKRELKDRQGRPIAILPFGEPIRELLG